MYQTIKKLTVGLFPRKMLFKLEPAFRRLLYLFYKGDSYTCNICDAHLNAFIQLPNSDLLCPRCGSISRNRRLWQLLEDEFVKPNAVILDFSPSRSLYRKLKNMESVNYTGTDLSNDFLADKSYDITKIEASDASFDLIICYHILEHVLNDVLAMKELFRVLKTNGICLIQTPFKEGDIYEDDTIISEADRLIHFGQEDHVRIYSVEGLKERLGRVGFEVDVRHFRIAGNSRNGLQPGETTLVCRKPKEV